MSSLTVHAISSSTPVEPFRVLPHGFCKTKKSFIRVTDTCGHYPVKDITVIFPYQQAVKLQNMRQAKRNSIGSMRSCSIKGLERMDTESGYAADTGRIATYRKQGRPETGKQKMDHSGL